MNESIMFVLLIALAVMTGIISASPNEKSLEKRGESIKYRTRRGLVDLFQPISDYPTARRSTCLYKGEEFQDGVMVDTTEPCLKCRCLAGTLVCYLRVCPALPDPPPPHCVLVLRRGACCSELICEDGAVQTNHISRAEPNGIDLPLDSTISFGDGKGCIENGTLYESGSAMSSSSLCEYCYCISGVQKCVKPRCLLPFNGCKPRRSPHSCCPVRYDCDHQDPTTTTLVPTRINGCNVDGVLYPEGDRVTNGHSPCNSCFCMRGRVRCVPLSCAPPLLGCTPIILPGKCCASSYDCSKKVAEVKANNEILQIPRGLTTRDKIEQDALINERSFPDDTPLSPAQIAEILLSADTRVNRRKGLDPKQNITVETKKSKPKINNSEIIVATKTTKLPNKQNDDTTSTSANPNKQNEFSNTNQKIHSKYENDSTTTSKNIFPSKTYIDTDTITNETNDNITDRNNESMNNSSSIIETLSKSNISREENGEKTISSSNITEKEKTDIPKVILKDTINCTTELSSIDENINISDDDVDELIDQLTNFNDTQERRPNTSDIIETINSTLDEENSDIDENTTSNIITNIGSQFPSHSLIIPKDDDIFMVNVSTFVRTNTSVVTLRPVAAIPPEIEAILNLNNKKNAQKDDYVDYDYKSSLPPSLPNLKIIPFLAIDAVLKSDETAKEKSKSNIPYPTAYPQVETKSILGQLPTKTRDKYNVTKYPYINSDPFNPTTFTSHNDDKFVVGVTASPPVRSNNFNRNPVYRQHINDKFQATTYVVPENKYDFAQEKFDSIPLDDSKTNNPTYEFESDGMNLFSPPVETEGGFVPRDPPLLHSYYDAGFPTSGDTLPSVTDSSLMVTNHAKTPGDNCISNDREYKNGELITEEHACVICFCYYGDIHCQDPECPPIKPGCRRIIEKGSGSCCGIEICNDELFGKVTTTIPVIEKDTQTKPSTKMTEKKSTLDPFKDVIRTEPAPDLQLLIGDMSYFVRKNTTPTTTTENPQESTYTKIPTFIIPSKFVNSSTSSISPSKSITTEKYENKTEKSLEFHNKVNISTHLIQDNYSSQSFKETTTTFVPIMETTAEEYEIESIPEEEEEEEFSFDSVLKLLLGDTSETTTRSTTIRTTRRFTTPLTQMTTSWRPSTLPPTTARTTTESMTIPSTTKLNTTPVSISTPLYKSTHKYAFTKPMRNISSISILNKNFTKPKPTSKPPSAYPTINRFTKLKYTYSPTPLPLTTESIKKIVQPILPMVEPPNSSAKNKISSDSAIPFGAGLLKLAGCNIYGRMYRVGRIITELSGPCLECMCTEIGVQCRNLPC